MGSYKLKSSCDCHPLPGLVPELFKGHHVVVCVGTSFLLMAKHNRATFC